ncbi:DNA (cytosine-5-)-methyltransferase [[Mycoplasma] anseris]|uniref:Cytosine-specific methyltransferase n=2 Tax=[Mycoplasma] anseris TaxID=92400 RepID=A0A2Z4NDT7_9BACT|nr:DNA (cytosine-5-)-methyltransferase [[Mycoplasma] anseris]
MVETLNKYCFSNDSKTIINKYYFSNIKLNKLQKIFPYLYAYVDNEYLNKVYKLNSKWEGFTDINQFFKLPNNIDILTYSFPCQDLSQQGKQKGIIKGNRSGLLYEIERILKTSINSLPKCLVLENVKALTSKRFFKDFNNWINVLDELGYKSKWSVLNASEFGSSQNRERVFLVSLLKSNPNEFHFPKSFKHKNSLSRIIDMNDNHINCSHLLNHSFAEFKTSNQGIIKSTLLNYTSFNSESYIYKPDLFGPTLTASGANSRIKIYDEKRNKLFYMNAIEVYQYMGFDKEDALKVKQTEILPENKMIFTCGNSISVEVLEALFQEVIKCL